MQDDSGIPKNTVDFTLKFRILQNKIENILVFMEWPGDNDKLESMDLGYIEEWAKVDPQCNPEEAYFVTYEKKIE